MTIIPNVINALSDKSENASEPGNTIFSPAKIEIHRSDTADRDSQNLTTDIP